MKRIGFTLFVIVRWDHIYRFDKRRVYEGLDNPHLIS